MDTAIPSWLIGLITALIVVIIILAIYMIIAFRRIGITAKKMDYLTEDLSYKLEKLSPTLDSLLKLSNYIEMLDSVIKADGSKIVNKISQNKDDILKLLNQIKEFLQTPNSPNAAAKPTDPPASGSTKLVSSKNLPSKTKEVK